MIVGSLICSTRFLWCLHIHMLRKQLRTSFLAESEMNWLVLLKDAYDGNGFLIEKDPQVVFNEKLYKYAQVDQMEPGCDDDGVEVQHLT